MQHALRQRTSAFSLIELLVAIAIIGTLVGLLMPAIQASRESARIVQCQSNLRQIGIATLNFESHNGRLPPGSLSSRPGVEVIPINQQHIGTLPFLMPFMESGDLIRQEDVPFDVSETGLNWWALGDRMDRSKNHVEAFVCPSSPEHNGAFLSLRVYEKSGKPRLGSKTQAKSRGGNKIGVTNYLGVAGLAGIIGLPKVDAFHGPFTPRSRTRMLDFKRGTSNTLLFGEAAGSSKGKVQFSWYGGGSMPTFWGLGILQGFRFGSHHQDINFLMADGRIKTLTKDLHTAIFSEMAMLNE